LITQLELEKKLSEINSQMRYLKDDSIYKKSSDERRDLFYDIKREEEEERKRIEEEKRKAKEF
jgi:hypothetical protein